jgi:hypothetical protein
VLFLRHLPVKFSHLVVCIDSKYLRLCSCSISSYVFLPPVMQLSKLVLSVSTVFFLPGTSGVAWCLTSFFLRICLYHPAFLFINLCFTIFISKFLVSYFPLLSSSSFSFCNFSLIPSLFSLPVVYLAHWVFIIQVHKSKSKVIPLQALAGLEGSRWLRVPDFKTFGT